MVRNDRFSIIMCGLLVGLSGISARANIAHEIQAKHPRHDHIVRLLAARNADPNASVNGCPLIIYVTMKLARKKTADANKWHALLQTLLAYKARVDEKDTNLYTALMYAAYYGHYDAVRLLLAYKAQVDYDVRGKTPLSLAQEGRASALTQKQKDEYTKIIQLLNRMKTS